MRFDEHFLKGALPDACIISNVFPEEPLFTVDSRTAKPGEIFVALTGNRVDGHNFVKDALQKGVAGVIISEANKQKILEQCKELITNKLVVVVADTLKALVRCAAFWRSQFTYPVVAITGSVGKTSTKEMVSHILTAHGVRHVASKGTQNTRIGISLNMLRMRSHHQAAVFEVGINRRGEMAELAKLVNPTTAVITNIHHTHMEHLGSLADIATEKRDIFKYFTEESVGIINGDQAILANISYVHPLIRFGSKMTNQIQARKVHVDGLSIEFVLKIYKAKYRIRLARIHQGVIFNALAATSVAHYLGIPAAVIVAAIANPPQVPGRFEEKQLKQNRGILIDDCYNANPYSMKLALLAFQTFQTKAQKVAVLGDMLELGVNSPFWHRQLCRFLRKVPSLQRVILVGEFMKNAYKVLPVGLQVELVANWQEAIGKLDTILDKESVVLVKGSKAIGLENLVYEFT